MARISILGAGGWGLAIANLISSSGHSVTLWEYDPSETSALSKTRRDETRLPGISLDTKVRVTSDLMKAAVCETLIIAVPTQHVRGVLTGISHLDYSCRLIVSLSKGLEIDTLRRVSEIVAESLGNEIGAKTVALSGPSHAEEVARGIPTSVVVAGTNAEAVEEAQHLLATPLFRVYGSADIIGVELGGALKNVIAVSAGMIYGLSLGDNTMGALLTRGLAEISRLGTRMGARPETFAGLSGLGDLVTTCMSKHSRNRAVGERIGRGEKLNEILESMTMVAEGVSTTKAAAKLADKYQVEMPITRQVNAVLFEGKSPREALAELMTRELKREVYS